MRKREKRARRKNELAIVDFIMVMNHFFPLLKRMAIRDG